MATSSGGVSEITTVLTEGTDGQYVEVDLVEASEASIDTSAISAISGTLVDPDSEEIVFGPVSVLPDGGSSRGLYPEDLPGTFRVTFTDDDLDAVGNRECQMRSLFLTVTHSGGLTFRCVVRFPLRNLVA